MLETKIIAIGLAILLGGGALAYGAHAIYKLIIERETCKVGLEQQNQAILEQNIEVNDYVSKLQFQKDAITKKYNTLAQRPLSCEHELNAIKHGLEVFKNEK
ncbi:hypothetical protein [Helicobacter sp. L8]|uniref:hypothetical protein n=1 Tax=Helicobacter sp. L8 TaxID=2316078 RepID=UPI000EB227F1|nr:hypothetical protein [Helicobacter sp. L8]